MYGPRLLRHGTDAVARAKLALPNGLLKVYPNAAGATSRTLLAVSNYASTLCNLRHFEEVKSLLCRSIPVGRRVFGEGGETTLRMRSNYAVALVNADGATHEDLREAVTTLEETERIARRVLGGAHPLVVRIEFVLRQSRAALRARETPSSGEA